MHLIFRVDHLTEGLVHFIERAGYVLSPVVHSQLRTDHASFRVDHVIERIVQVSSRIDHGKERTDHLSEGIVHVLWHALQTRARLERMFLYIQRVMVLCHSSSLMVVWRKVKMKELYPIKKCIQTCQSLLGYRFQQKYTF